MRHRPQTPTSIFLHTAAGESLGKAGPDGPHAEEAAQGGPQGAHILADDYAA